MMQLGIDRLSETMKLWVSFDIKSFERGDMDCTKTKPELIKSDNNCFNRTTIKTRFNTTPTYKIKVMYQLIQRRRIIVE